MVGNLRVFRYLNGGDGRSRDDVLGENYSINDLADRVVIRDEYHGNYRVLSGWDEFWAWRDTIPVAEQCLDEVIFGNFPQHLKFDIDAPSADIDAIPMDLALKFGGATRAAIEPDPEIEEYLADLLGDSCAAGAADAPQQTDREIKVEAIVGGIIDVILDELQGAYFGLDDISATRDDLIVTESSGQVRNDYKYSFHMIVAPYAVANNEEAKGFTARVLSQLPAPIRKLVDPQVNKTVQNFRLVGSSKPVQGGAFRRVKEITDRFRTGVVPREQTVIRAQPGTRVLTRLYTEVTPDGQTSLIDSTKTTGQVPEISGDDMRTVLALVQETGAGNAHEFQRARGRLLIFRRNEPSYCAICRRTHDNDNTLMVSTEEVEAGDKAPWCDPAAKVPHRVVEHCRRSSEARTIGVVNITRLVAFDTANGFAAAKPTDETQQETRITVGARIVAIHEGDVDPHLANATELERLPVAQRQVYAEPQMRAYESVPTLAVKAQMKLGKTKALRDYLDREYPVRENAIAVPVIRMVTFRQTFSKSMQRETFKEFDLYSDHKGDLDQVRFPRLIVQVESLHRLRMGDAPEPIDVLILDEVESILAQFNSGLHRRFNAAFAMFQWMLSTARRVICMDANIGDRTLHILQAMRPAHPIHFHWNQFQRAAEDKFYFTADQTVWLDHLYEALGAGKRVVIPANSLTEASAFEESIRRRFPDRSVRLYSSQTLPSEKERHFADVHTFWTDLDVLIYTPTVSAGVSYELEHFDMLFGYFTDMSCDVETCRQMLARVRNIGSKEHLICLAGRATNLPTAIDDIRRLVHDKRSNLYRHIDEAGSQLALQFEYDANGEIVYHESPYFRLWLETCRIDNLSKNNFVARFIDQVADTGASVDILEALPDADGRLVDIKSGQKGIKGDLAIAECEAISTAPDLDPDEAAAVRERLSHQIDVSSAERLGYTKYRLCETYRWHGRPMSAEFVDTYRKSAVISVYYNLQRITSEATVVESLHAIQTQEVGNHRLLMESRLAVNDNDAAASQWDSRDLHHRYVFQAHFFAIMLLRMCGFLCITDRSLTREESMFESMRAGEQKFMALLEKISFEFQMRRPSVKAVVGERDSAVYIKRILGFVNPILRKMYGIEIKRASKRANSKNFYISHTPIGRLFVFLKPGDPVPPDDAANGLKPHIISRLDPVGRDDEAHLAMFLEDCHYDREDDPDDAIGHVGMNNVADNDGLEAFLDEFGA